MTSGDPARPPTTEQLDARGRLIDAVKHPIGFFSLVTLVIETALLVLTVLVIEDQRLILLSFGFIVLIFLSLLVVYLHRSEARDRRTERDANIRSLALLFANSVYDTLVPYLRNLPQSEQKEAMDTLTTGVREAVEGQEQQFHVAFANHFLTAMNSKMTRRR